MNKNSFRFMLTVTEKHNLEECATAKYYIFGYKEAQSERMSIIGEGIECLVTKTSHTHSKGWV